MRSLIAKIFLGEIVNWNDPAIATANPQLAGDLPNQKIIPVYRSDASGENYLLSDYLLHQDTDRDHRRPERISIGSSGQPTAMWPTPAPGSIPSPTTYPGWAEGNLVGESGRTMPPITWPRSPARGHHLCGDGLRRGALVPGGVARERQRCRRPTDIGQRGHRSGSSHSQPGFHPEPGRRLHRPPTGRLPAVGLQLSGHALHPRPGHGPGSVL